MNQFIRSHVARPDACAGAARRTPRSRCSPPRADWGALDHRARRRPGQRVRRHDRAAGRASRRCQAQPGRARAQRRSRGRHRRRARGRLAARADPGVGQRAIQPGAPGYFEAAAALELLEVPTQLDRSMGDIHPHGNPHVQLDPHNIATVAQALTARLAQLDPAHAAVLRGARPRTSIRAGRPPSRAGRAKAAPLKGAQRRDHASRPGVPVSLARTQRGRRHRAQARRAADRRLPRAARHASSPPRRRRMILLNAYNDPKAANWLSERVHAPVVVLPFSVGGTPEAKDLFGLFDDTLTAAGGAQMNRLLHRSQHPVAGADRGLSRRRSRTCRSDSRCCRAASCSSTSRSRRSRASASSPRSSFGLPIEGWGAQVAAGAAALAGALLLTWTERKRPEVQEALIGILFVLASTAQILLLANDPHGGENLKDLLAGQILWVSNEPADPHGGAHGDLRCWCGSSGASASVASASTCCSRIVVTASVQLVGVYLVFTSSSFRRSRRIGIAAAAARPRLRARVRQLPRGSRRCR